MNFLQTLSAAFLLAAVPAAAGPLSTSRPVAARTAPVASLAPVAAALGAPSLAPSLIAPSLMLSQGLPVPTLELPLARVAEAAAVSAPEPLARALPAASAVKAANAADAPRPAAKKTPVLESLRELAKNSENPKKSGETLSAFDGAGPLHLAVVGPPGVGKTTQAKRLAKETGIVHISVGQLLREYAEDKPAIRSRMNEGKLVDTRLVMGLVRERLSRPDVKEHGFILDGFPRRPVEEAALREILGEEQKLDAVIRLDAPREELKRRILARGRDDDNAEVFEERMRVYGRETLPVIETLEKTLPEIRPDGRMKKVDSIYASLVSRLSLWLNSR